MEIRHATHPDQLAALDTDRLRERFLVEGLFTTGEVKLVYSHEDRIVIGGVSPLPGTPLELESADALRADTFLARRELAVVVVRGSGSVTVDETEHKLDARDCVYVGRGATVVRFQAAEEGTRFYLFSTPSHAEFPTTVARYADVDALRLGDQATSNVREIRKFVHADGIRSSQLVLGMTTLAPGSVWNTMPPHTHDRRTEAYLYFDLPDEHRVVHLMGEPQATRNLLVRNEEVVISPSWSVHGGAGTHAYSFVWAMGGENQAYDDVEPVAVTDLR